MVCPSLFSVLGFRFANGRKRPQYDRALDEAVDYLPRHLRRNFCAAHAEYRPKKQRGNENGLPGVQGIA